MMGNFPKQSGYRETAWLLLSRVLALFVALGLQSLLAYELAPKGMGIYGVWIGLAIVGSAVFSFGADRAIQCRMIEGKLIAGHAIGLSLTMAITPVFVVGLLCILAWWLGMPWLQTVDKVQCFLGLLLMGAIAAQTSLLLLLQGLRRFSAVAMTSVLIASLKLALAAGAVLWFGWGVTGALLASFVGIIIGVFVGGVYLFVSSGSTIGWPPWHTFAHICRFALQYLPARWGNAGYWSAIMLVLAMFAPIAQVGIFALAVALVNPILFITQSVSDVLLPRIGADKSGEPLLVARCCRLLTVALGGLLVGVLFLGYLFIPILFSRAFSSSAPLLWVVGIGIWIQGACNPLLSYVIGIGKPKVASVSVVARMITTLATLPMLYSWGGLTGAALSTVLGQTVASLVLAAYFHKHSRMTVSKVWLWNRGDMDILKRLFFGRLGRDDACRDPEPQCSAHTLIRSRQTFMTSGKVVKLQSTKITEWEWERTKWGQEIAEQTGLFVVPAITKVNLVHGELHFERIDDMVPMREVLHNDAANADRMLRDAAKSLAALHDSPLPDTIGQRPLACWEPTGRDSLVRIHGDYALCNLFYSRRDDKLAILDWATTDRLGAEANVAPCEGEVCWFVYSLFGRRYWRFGLRDPERLTEVFVQTYCRHRRQTVEEIDLYRFLLAHIETIYRIDRECDTNWLRKWTRFRRFQLVGRSLENKAQKAIRVRSPSSESLHAA